jgi:hypothetical protein
MWCTAGLFIGRIFQPPNQIVFNSGGAGYMLDTKALTVRECFSLFPLLLFYLSHHTVAMSDHRLENLFPPCGALCRSLVSTPFARSYSFHISHFITPTFAVTHGNLHNTLPASTTGAGQEHRLAQVLPAPDGILGGRERGQLSEEVHAQHRAL